MYQGLIETGLNGTNFHSVYANLLILQWVFSKYYLLTISSYYYDRNNPSSSTTIK